MTIKTPPVTPFFIIHTDGGARGNPGPAATGIVVLDSSDNLIHQFGRYLGVATNNVAEYTAVLDALNWILAYANRHHLNPSLLHLHFRLDSQLVVQQLSKRWQIKDPHLQTLNNQIQSLISQHQLQTDFEYIPRSQNSAADFQVNLALDRAILLQ